MKCSMCGKDVDVKYARLCRICKKIICLDCVKYIVVKRETLYKKYEEQIPVCQNCYPKVKIRGKLAKILDDVFG